MTTQLLSQCNLCEHYRSPLGGGTEACAAFPSGIPRKVLDNEVDHRNSIDGDHGITWKSRNGADFPTEAFEPDDKAKTRSQPMNIKRSGDTSGQQSMNVKTLRASGFQIKNADLGEFSAVLATLGVIDSDGDVTETDAFDGSDFPISAYGHKSWEGALPVGVGRVKEVGNQIIVEGQFFMDTTHGRDTFLTVKRLGPLGQWSYGYDVLDHSMGMR